MARLTARSFKRDSRYEKKSTEKAVAEMKSVGRPGTVNAVMTPDGGRSGAPVSPGRRSLEMVRWRRTGTRSLETWGYVSLFF